MLERTPTASDCRLGTPIKCPSKIRDRYVGAHNTNGPTMMLPAPRTAHELELELEPVRKFQWAIGTGGGGSRVVVIWAPRAHGQTACTREGAAHVTRLASVALQARPRRPQHATHAPRRSPPAPAARPSPRRRQSPLLGVSCHRAGGGAGLGNRRPSPRPSTPQQLAGSTQHRSRSDTRRPLPVTARRELLSHTLRGFRSFRSHPILTEERPDALSCRSTVESQPGAARRKEHATPLRTLACVRARSECGWSGGTPCTNTDQWPPCTEEWSTSDPSRR